MASQRGQRTGVGHITGAAAWLGTGQPTPVILERVGCFPRVGSDEAIVLPLSGHSLQSLEKAESTPPMFLQPLHSQLLSFPHFPLRHAPLPQLQQMRDSCSDPCILPSHLEGQGASEPCEEGQDIPLVSPQYLMAPLVAAGSGENGAHTPEGVILVLNCPAAPPSLKN